MKRFLVIWSQEALNTITDLWAGSRSDIRDAIVKAWLRIDQTLEQDPEGVGESRDNGRRVYFDNPLAVKYSVLADKKEVHLLDVWTFRRKLK